MDEEYDAIVLGTGFTECVLSGLLSVHRKKVLHIDRNDYYGGASASLNLIELFRQFADGAAPPAELGHSRDYNIDLVPKFIMADGMLVQILVHTDVAKYLEFRSVAGSYVVKAGAVHKVPATPAEALSTGLVGFLEKRNLKSMLEWIHQYNPEDKKTHTDPSGGWFSSPPPMNLHVLTMRQFYAKFGVDKDTIDFVGHSIALHLDETYLDQPAHPTLLKIRLYFKSLLRFSNSPYLYPLYGLGELPQAFARLAAIWGGTYMLHTPVDEVVLEDGHFVGVRSGDQIAKAKIVIGDPSYFPDRVKKVGRVVRIICLMDHPIANTNNSDSCQIIIPQNQVGRHSDIYVSLISGAHNVVPKNMYVAMVSTTIETDNPERECEPGIRLLGKILNKFISITDAFEPTDDGTDSKVFISKSYDATSHFETTCLDVLDIYRRVTGEELDLTAPPVVPTEESHTPE